MTRPAVATRVEQRNLLAGDWAVASTLLYLRLLHPWQENARFSGSLPPAAERGVMCSTEKGSALNRSGLLQYSQHPAARPATARRAAPLTRSSATRPARQAQFADDGVERIAAEACQFRSQREPRGVRFFDAVRQFHQ
jgi:hypothetical protein